MYDTFGKINSCTFAAMHVNVQTRFNAALGREVPYYRFKESYRDNVHSIIILNVGFEPEFLPKQMFRIANALTDRFKNRTTKSLIVAQQEKLDLGGEVGLNDIVCYT